MIVSNSTVLIYLAKINRLHFLKIIFKKVIIPPEVYSDVVTEGKKQNHIDATVVEQAINEGWIQVRKIKIDPLLAKIGIHKGEAEAIALANNMKKRVLLDQTHAREAAKMLGLKPVGTIYVLLQILKKKKINYEEYLLCLLDLIDVGFRMSEEVYIEAVRLGKSL